MRDKKTFELFQKTLDGTISRSEKKKLNRVLSQDPEIQTTLHQLQQVTDLMDRIPQVEPPSDLSNGIMNRIDLKRYPRKDVKPVRNIPVKSILAKFEPKMAIAFGVGAVAVLFILILMQDHRIDIPENDWKDYYGTIGINENLNFKSKEKIPIHVQSIRGSITHKQTGAVLGLEISLQADQNFELWVEYDAQHLRWNGIKPLNGLSFGLETGNNILKIIHKTDMELFLFFIRTGETESPLDLKLLQSDEMVWQGKIGNGLSVNE
jgi:hypothetical protein